VNVLLGFTGASFGLKKKETPAQAPVTDLEDEIPF